MPFSTRNGLNVFYEAVGAGPPMILIHANPFDHRLWMYQQARYSVTHRVVAIDLRGYGRSDKPSQPFTLRDMASDVLSVCADEGITRAPFLGVSVGSRIAMLIALERPEIVSQLVLVGGASCGAPSMKARIDGFLSDDLGAYQRQHLRDCVAPDFARSALGEWILSLFNQHSAQLSGVCIANIFRARLACDLTDRLSAIHAPTLVINGELDMSMRAGQVTAAAIPGALHRTIAGAGHACNIEKPELFDALLREFLTN